jgi:hypothetical protein
VHLLEEFEKKTPLPSSSFGGQFSVLGDEKKDGATFTMEFWGKRRAKVPRFLRKKPDIASFRL